MISLRNSQPDVLLIYAVTPKACSQAIRKSHEMNWRPVRFISSACVNKQVILKPAGLEASEGLLSLLAFKDPATDPEDPDILQYIGVMRRYLPGIEPDNLYPVYGVTVAQGLIAVLKHAAMTCRAKTSCAKPPICTKSTCRYCGPASRLNTSPEDYAPLKAAYLMRFDGTNWRQAGGLLQ